MYIKLVKKIVEAISPYDMFLKHIKLNSEGIDVCGDKYAIINKQKIHLIGVGKASSDQIDKLLLIFKNNNCLKMIRSAIAITKKNHLVKNPSLIQIESSHPYCDYDSLNATDKLTRHLKSIHKNDFIIFCISGGTSSLLLKPCEDILLEDFMEMNKLLVNSNSTIEQINIVRKSFSRVKNGGLLKYISATNFINLGVCDIPSNDFSMLGSSPTYYEKLDKDEIFKVIERSITNIKLKNKLLNYLESKKWETQEKQKAAASKRKNYKNYILADFNFLIDETDKILKEEFSMFDIIPIKECLNQDLENIVDIHLAKIKESGSNSFILYSGGEATLNVEGNGCGGRNMHFSARIAYKLFDENVLNLSEKEQKRFKIISFGTDGTDGPTEYAGSYIDYISWKKALDEGHKVKKYLDEFNTLEYFEQTETLIKTGATGTNLMDMRIIIFE